MDNVRHSAQRTEDSTSTSQRHRAVVVYGMAALLCIVVAVPLLRMLTSFDAQAGRTSGRTSAHSASSPTVTAVPPEVAAVSPNARHVAEVSYVNSLIAHMSLQEEIGQMIQISFWGEKKLQPWMLDEISRDHVGSVILYGANIQTVPQARAWVRAMQARASIPLFVATDLEGGAVNRLAAIAPDL
ncbi:MAG TPA: glycoside hydrolase family 3 N-terminal domain-containing protein, partial [Ktedonobacterales bacterium]